LPATISPLLGETTMDEFHFFVEKLMSDALLPFAKTDFNMMSA
jgi:cell shape-determining protein MreD